MLAQAVAASQQSTLSDTQRVRGRESAGGGPSGMQRWRRRIYDKWMRVSLTPCLHCNHRARGWELTPLADGNADRHHHTDLSVLRCPPSPPSLPPSLSPSPPSQRVNAETAIFTAGYVILTLLINAPLCKWVCLCALYTHASPVPLFPSPSPHTCISHPSSLPPSRSPLMTALKLDRISEEAIQMRRHVSAMRGRGAGKKHSRTRRLATWAKAGGSPPPPIHPPTHPHSLPPPRSKHCSRASARTALPRCR